MINQARTFTSQFVKGAVSCVGVGHVIAHPILVGYLLLAFAAIGLLWQGLRIVHGLVTVVLRKLGIQLSEDPYRGLPSWKSR